MQLSRALSLYLSLPLSLARSVQQFIWPVPLDVDQTGLHEDLRAEWAALLAAATCK